VHVQLVTQIKLITVHRTATYPVFWRQGVQNSNHSPDTKTQFVDVALTVQKNVEAVRCNMWLRYTSSRIDHPELTIIPFDTFNLCDRSRNASDNNNNNNNNNKQNIIHERNNITFSTKYKYKIAATIHTL